MTTGIQRQHLRSRSGAMTMARARWVLVGAGLLLIAASTLAQFNLRKIRGVKYPELYEKEAMVAAGRGHTNQLKGLLMGEEGEFLSAEVIRIRTMQLEHYEVDGRTNLVARAPECLFNAVTRLAWSTGRLEITALEGRFFIESNEGFEGSLTNTSLILSNRVRTVLQQNLTTLQNR